MINNEVNAILTLWCILYYCSSVSSQIRGWHCLSDIVNMDYLHHTEFDKISLVLDSCTSFFDGRMHTLLFLGEIDHMLCILSSVPWNPISNVQPLNFL